MILKKIMTLNLHKKVFLFAFLWAAVWAVLVQFIILPYILTQWHAGDGLLKGGDWLYFQQVALDAFEKIKNQGWRAWELYPDRQGGPAGIVAAHYAVTGIAKPWTMIPLNAAVHGLAAMVLFDFLVRFFPSRAAVIGVLPFIVFPTAMLWYTMIHKDSLFIAGCLIFFWGWVEAARLLFEKNAPAQYVRVYAAIVLGLLFIVLVRPYYLDISRVVALFLFSFLMMHIFYASRRNRKTLPQILIASLITFLALLVTFSIDKPSRIMKKIPNSGGGEQLVITDWNYSPYIPDFLENRLWALSKVRDRFRLANVHGRTKTDIDTAFRSVSDALAFIPRGMNNALLRPSPSIAFEKGSSDQTTLMRKIAAVEMLLIYVGLAGFIWAAIRFWYRPEFIVISMASFLSLLSYALVIANIGALHRYRYAFLMTIVGFGAAQLAYWWEKHKHNKEAQ